MTPLYTPTTFCLPSLLSAGTQVNGLLSAVVRAAAEDVADNYVLTAAC